MDKDEKDPCNWVFLPFDYDVIFSYTNQKYSSKSSYSRNYINEVCIQPSREDIKLGIKNIEPSFEDNIEVVEIDQLLWQVDELKLKDNISRWRDQREKKKIELGICWLAK